MRRRLAVLGLMAVALAAAFVFWLCRPPALPPAASPESPSPGLTAEATLSRSGPSLASEMPAGSTSQPRVAVPAGVRGSGSPSRPASSFPGSAAHEWPEAVRTQVEHFKDHSIAVARRLEELEALARKGDATSIQILEALGLESTYLNYAAVEALGRARPQAGIADYLRSRLKDPDPRVLSAAVRSLARQQGPSAVEDIEKVIKSNRQRPDGFQDTVCAACVQALADTRSAAAIPIFDVELRETVGPLLSHDYGSQVVAALLAIGDVAARPVLLAYADRLGQVLARGDDNPLGRRYVESKIKEAREAADSLGQPLNLLRTGE